MLTVIFTVSNTRKDNDETHTEVFSDPSEALWCFCTMCSFNDIEDIESPFSVDEDRVLTISEGQNRKSFITFKASGL